MMRRRDVFYNNIILCDVLTDVHRMRYIFVRVTEYGHFKAVVRPFYRRLGRFQRLQVIFFAGTAHGQERQTRDYDFGQHLDEKANRIETSVRVHYGVPSLVGRWIFNIIILSYDVYVVVE